MRANVKVRLQSLEASHYLIWKDILCPKSGTVVLIEKRQGKKKTGEAMKLVTVFLCITPGVLINRPLKQHSLANLRRKEIFI